MVDEMVEVSIVPSSRNRPHIRQREAVGLVSKVQGVGGIAKKGKHEEWRTRVTSASVHEFLTRQHHLVSLPLLGGRECLNLCTRLHHQYDKQSTKQEF
jgi:hypothetical protein